MASPIQWTWVWVNSGIWWWTGRPSMLQSMGLQRVGQADWTELTELRFMVSLWRTLLEVPWRTRTPNQSILKKINPEYSLMLKLKLHYFGHLMWIADLLMLGKIEGRRRRGQQRMRMVGWYHWLNGHEFEQTLRDSEGQGILACCSPWGVTKSQRGLSNSTTANMKTVIQVVSTHPHFAVIPISYLFPPLVSSEAT